MSLQVLSLPSNFTYNPPGSKRSERHPSTYSQARRQTLHSQQPIMLSNMDDIRNIDESLSDIYKCIEESNEKNVRHRLRTNLDDIIALNRSDNFLKISTEPEEKYQLKKINENIDDNNTNLLSLPIEQKPLNKLYGSTKHLFSRQKSMEITEETPFLLAPTLNVIDTDKKELKIPKHDSQESVQRVITERRKLDENFKDIDQYDIFDISSSTRSSSEENLIIDNNKDNSQNVNKDAIEVNIIKERENDKC